MTKVLEFEPRFAALLPETYELLLFSNLTVHLAVSRIILHGSRGPARKYRPDSDIDLSLVVEPTLSHSDQERFLEDIFHTTKYSWKGRVELDLAVVFEIQPCGLNCFEQIVWTDQICKLGGMDCFGLYKIGKGFNGLVSNAGIEVKRMYPCIKIWQRK
ncbi:MAG: nucleotidyltransferase domain-containing protein [Anaerolineales bacterium]